jgi:hypothetical protein
VSAEIPGAEGERAADFARRFAEFWSAPTPQGLERILAERVRLVTPLMPTAETLDQAKRLFATLFEQIPNLTAEVHRWGPTPDGVLIEFTLSGDAGGGPISWHAVDRFILGEDGLATERISYFDPLPIILTAARRPRSWPGFLRGQVRRIRG